ncbi:MBL fold metallo-hydrolase [Kitasatospora nipponensis]|uniref:MBL fold metallo-hydrolase n=1 Tax=Kitasatospora nipponensis TaxID=258049 RepID=A0ABP4GLC7_9ACTN
MGPHTPTRTGPFTTRRLDLGSFVRPASETGTGQPRVEPVLGYLVRRPEGLLLFDTGIGGGEPQTEAHYRPRRRPLAQALAAAEVDLADVSVVVNCHLHFDHCGGNPLLAPGTPILVQRTELARARRGHYTLDHLVDFPEVTYREVEGELEVWPGVRIIPTPGHTAGHQSLLVEQPDATLLLAGQARDFASEFGSDQLARQAHRDAVDPPLPHYPGWLDRIAELAPDRVLFAHDAAIWEPLD